MFSFSISLKPPRQLPLDGAFHTDLITHSDWVFFTNSWTLGCHGPHPAAIGIQKSVPRGPDKCVGSGKSERQVESYAPLDLNTDKLLY